MLTLETIEVTKEASICRICLNQPKSLNAVNSLMLNDLNKAMDMIENDADIKVVIIHGQGKAFMAGGDIKEMMKMSDEEAAQFVRDGNAVYTRMANLKQPVIAAMHGFALGGGLELALTCDIRISDKDIKLGFPEVGLGIIPGYGGTQRASRLIGNGQTKRLVLTGEIIDGQEGYRLGLIEKLVEPDQILDEAKKMAQKISRNAPLAIEKAKESINLGSDRPLQEGLTYENNKVIELFSTQDRKEGMAAFVEKRKAEFKRK